VPDPHNPRLVRHAKNKKAGLSKDEIFDILIKEGSLHELRDSILANGAIAVPIIVQFKDRVAIIREGNRRWAGYTWLFMEYPDDTRWHEMPCYVVPSNLSEAHLKLYISIIHNFGKLEWGSYEKAADLASNIEHLGAQEIANHFGVEVKDLNLQLTIKKLCDRYMREMGTNEPRWSTWSLAHKAKPGLLAKGLKNAKHRKVVYQAVFDNKFADKNDARLMPDIITNSRAVMRLKKHNAKYAHEAVANDKYPYQALATMLQRMNGCIEKNKDDFPAALKERDKTIVERSDELLQSMAEHYKAQGRGDVLKEILEFVME
jgi:hypothetical protein